MMKPWERRLREIVLAGGALAAGCTSIVGNNENVPCGNANPDPCICGRPETSDAEATLCNQKTACENAGGVFDSYDTFDEDGGEVAPHCTFPDAGADDHD